jgi:transcriptional regulator with XRE-family HTH domain
LSQNSKEHPAAGVSNSRSSQRPSQQGSSDEDSGAQAEAERLAPWKIQLRRLREERKLSRKRLAGMLGMENDDTIYRWEELTGQPSPEQLLQLADVLKVSVHELVDIGPPVVITASGEMGSGKTYQFLLSALERLLASKGHPTKVEISVEGGGRIVASGIQPCDDPPVQVEPQDAA